MSENDKETLKLELKVVLTIVAMVAGVIAAHFAGVESSKNYTDKKFDVVIEKISEISTSVTRIETELKHNK